METMAKRKVKFEYDHKLKWSYSKKSDTDLPSKWKHDLKAFVANNDNNNTGEVNENELFDTEAFTNPLALAKASSLAYGIWSHQESWWWEIYSKFKERKYEMLDKKISLPEWTVLCMAQNEENHYVGIALIKRNPLQIIIAHRGTYITSSGAILADVNGIVQNRLTAQINSASTFVISMTHFLKNFPRIQIAITGHSLGGWLAQLTTFVAKYVELDSEHLRFIYSRDELTHVHCVAFDSPGTKQILQKLNREIHTEGYYNAQDGIGRLDITVYLGLPNIVNVVNEHVGELIQIELKGQEGNPIVGPTGSKFHYSNEVHQLDKFIEALESECPLMKQIINWPLVIYTNWNTEDAFEYQNASGSKRCANILYKAWNMWRSGAGEEFNQWFKDCFSSQVRYHLVPFYENSISMNCFSSPELKCIEDLRQLIYYSKHINVNSVLESSKKLSDFIRYGEWDFKVKGRIQIPDRTVIHILKNLANSEKFKNELSELVATLPSMSEILLVLASEDYEIDLKDQYLDVDFEENEMNFDSDKLTFDPEIPDNLIRLKLLNCVKKSNYSNSKLILKFETLLKLQTIFGEINLPKNIDCVVIDCLGTCSSEIKFSNTIKDVKYVWISNSDKNSGIELDFNVEESTYHLILAQNIQSQGRQTTFGQLIQEMTLSKFNDHFSGDLTNLSKLLDKKRSMEVEISQRPPSFFQNENNYVQVQRSVNINCNDNLERIFHNNPLLVIYGIHGKRKFDKALSKYQIRSLNFLIFPETKIQHVKFIFQTICKENKLRFVNLLELTVDAELVWHLQYNPKLYKERSFYFPPYDLPKLISACGRLNYGLHLNHVELASSRDSVKLRRDFDNEIIVENFPEGLDLGDFKNLNKPRLHEYELLTSQGRIVVIADDPGMGKSTTLSKVTEEYYENTISDWIFKIELKGAKITDRNLTDNLTPNLDVLTRFISESEGMDPMSKFLLRHKLEFDSDKILLALDGFDEMGHQFKKDMLILLTWFKQITKVKLIVTSRLHEIDRLEPTLGVFSHFFVPQTNQVEFLIDVWTGEIQEDADDQAKQIETFATGLIEKAKQYLEDDSWRLLGVPLQLRMLGEVYVIKLQKYLEGNENVEVHLKEYSLYSTYEQYFQRKFDIYYKGKHKIENWVDNVDLDSIEHKLMCLAGAVLSYGNESVSLKNEFLKVFGIDLSFLEKPIELNRLYSIGFVVNKGGNKKISDNCADFLHRTFAEFYFAKLLYLRIQNCFSETSVFYAFRQQIWKWIVCTCVAGDSNWVIRLFLDHLVRNDSRLTALKLTRLEKLQLGVLFQDYEPNILTFDAPTTKSLSLVIKTANENLFHLLQLFLNTLQIPYSPIYQYITKKINSNVEFFYFENSNFMRTVCVLGNYISRNSALVETVHSCPPEPCYCEGLRRNLDDLKEWINSLCEDFGAFIRSTSNSKHKEIKLLKQLLTDEKNSFLKYVENRMLNYGHDTVPFPYPTMNIDSDNLADCVNKYFPYLKDKAILLGYSEEQLRSGLHNEISNILIDLKTSRNVDPCVYEL